MIAVTIISAAAAALLLGGPQWTLLLTVPMLIAWRLKAGSRTVAATALVGLIWLVLHALTGESQLYFPFAMQCAIQTGCLLLNRGFATASFAGAGVAALFALVRISQDATARVLAVEIVVAAVALAAGLLIYSSLRDSAGARTTASLLGSLIAFAGLIF